MSDTVARLMALAAAKFNARAETLDPEADLFAVLDIDSLRALELLSDLEIEFDVEVPDYEFQGVRTFAGLAQVIDDRR